MLKQYRTRKNWLIPALIVLPEDLREGQASILL
jgi:hypothetical protein